MLSVHQITTMQREAVSRWHRSGVDNPYAGFLQIACHQCSLNYLLWHEEDAARNPMADHGEIALVKRTIDQLNQQRNDYIELMDHWIAAALQAEGIVASDEATLNTETPGSGVDRLSILALRIHHLGEQLDRQDVPAEHGESVRAKLSICHEQLHDLSTAWQQLVDDIFAGRKRHRLYRQFKMYNDPSLNPVLYGRLPGMARSTTGAVPAANRDTIGSR